MSEEIKKELSREEELKDKEIEQVSGGIGHEYIRVYCGQCKKLVKSVNGWCEECGSYL